MKSQLMTALSIVGVLGTATTAMAVNTDALSNLDPSAIGNATDTLLPGTEATSDPAQLPDAPTATPAPTDPSATPDPETGDQGRRGNAATPAVPAVPGQSPAVPAVPAVQNAQTQVHGTSGGSGTRVAPAPANGVVPAHQEDDHDDEQEHESEDDD